MAWSTLGGDTRCIKNRMVNVPFYYWQPQTKDLTTLGVAKEITLTALKEEIILFVASVIISILESPQRDTH